MEERHVTAPGGAFVVTLSQFASRAKIQREGSASTTRDQVRGRVHF
jgi:hypothetical protein